MRKAVLVLKMASSVPLIEDAEYIGVDAGTLVCLKQHIPMKYAVGDFDSVSEAEWNEICTNVEHIEKLNPVKDDSDSEHAIKEAVDQGYEEILVYGALGGRVDHELVNIRLAYKYPNIVRLIGEKNIVYVVKEGEYTFDKKKRQFISFFTDSQARITLEGFKYAIAHRDIFYTDTYTVSNEVEASQARLIVEKGTVCIIESSD